MSPTVHNSSVVASNNTWIGEVYSPLLIDKVNVMLKREESSVPCIDDYLNKLRLGNPNPHLDTFDEQFRQRTAEWMFKVVDFYDLDRDITSTAMNYLDRYLTASTLHHRLSKNQCCLISTACLKLAIKLLEPRTFHVTDMIKLG
ncbi:hypothetical protein ACHAWC_000136, partial [Mediolabrus comicus]